MVDTIWPVNAVAGSPAYSGRMLRQTLSPLVGGASASRPLGARTGVRPGTSTTTVTATSTTWSCGPFAGVADLETASEAGPYPFAFDAVATGSVTAANASYARVDIIYVQISDPAESDGSSVPSVVRGYLAGTASASPVAPTPPARSFVIANINVPVSGGGSPSVTWVAPTTVSAGGILPVGTLAQLNAISGVTGQYAAVTSDSTVTNRGLYFWNGTAWTVAQPGGLIPVVPSGIGTVTAGTVTVGANGVVTATAASNVPINGCFSSYFDNYLVVWDLPTISANDYMLIRMRSAGTDDAVATYLYQTLNVANTNVAALTSSAVAQFGVSSSQAIGTSASGELKFFNPALTAQTRIMSTLDVIQSTSAQFVSHSNGFKNANTAFDGFSFYPATSTTRITGKFRIYGYNNN